MENYFHSIMLLGLKDQNLPLYKETRVKRLKSIEKMQKLLNVLPRLTPIPPPGFLQLDPNDPEWDDQMIYPAVNNWKYFGQMTYWGVVTLTYAYNWNIIHANPRLKFIRYLYPVLSSFFLGSMIYDYQKQVTKVRLFENYTEVRAQELFDRNKFILDHPDIVKMVYFVADLDETLAKVHRQANNHDASDFKDSELILQDFIRRYSDESNPDGALFDEQGRIKFLN